MVGFSFKAKANSSNSKVTKPAFSIKKKPNVLVGKKKHFSNDSDDEDDGKIRKIDTFDIGQGAMSNNKSIDTKEVLVIKPPINENWIEVLKKKKEDSTNKSQLEATQTEEKMIYGLNIMKKYSAANLTEKEKDQEQTGITRNEALLDKDQLARQSLLANKSISQKLTIPQPTATDDITEEHEVDVFEKYEEIPVEEFGFALLRGMGWKDEDIDDTTDGPTSVNPRSGSLGIGAQPFEPIDEIGEWGRSKVYVPLVKRNKRTGEIVEEDKRSSKNSDSRSKYGNIKDNRSRI